MDQIEFSNSFVDFVGLKLANQVPMDISWKFANFSQGILNPVFPKCP
jgi:hypothetical protein